MTFTSPPCHFHKDRGTSSGLSVRYTPGPTSPVRLGMNPSFMIRSAAGRLVTWYSRIVLSTCEFKQAESFPLHKQKPPQDPAGVFSLLIGVLLLLAGFFQLRGCTAGQGCEPLAESGRTGNQLGQDVGDAGVAQQGVRAKGSHELLDEHLVAERLQ